MASPTNPAMMPVTIRIRCSRVAEIICTYSPTRQAARPVAVVMMTIAALVCVFLTIMPRANDTRPTTRVKMVSAFWSVCGCPSEFRILWRRPDSTVLDSTVPDSAVSAMVTTSWRSLSPPRERGIHSVPSGYHVRMMLGKLAGLRTTRLFRRRIRDRDTSCHGKTVAAPVQRRTQDAHAPLRDHDYPRPEPRGARRPAVARGVPQGRDRRRRQGREDRHLGQAPPGLPDREEAGGLLRDRGPDGGAERRARTRPPAQPERGHSADQGHPARAPLSGAPHGSRRHPDHDRGQPGR